MKTTILISVNHSVKPELATEYTLGVIIIFILLIYLIYSLIKPEKF